ncbi:MAG TPA: hypothetical protein VL043_02380 [Protaetiibacter sp.]|nr:hypothetical protein [Protaetiibacter sp.]
MTAVASLSPQQLDPLGGVTAQAFGWVLTAGAIGTSVGVSVVHRAEYRDGLFLAAAYACLAVACLIVVLASSPRRAPFTWRSALAVHLVGLAAVGFEAAAQWGGNVTVRSDWSPLALALLVMAMACFRPAAELLGMAAGSAVVVAAITAAGSAAAGAPLPPVVYGFLTGGPLLAAGVGAAAFSATAVRRLLRWREQTSELRRTEVERIRSRVRSELHDERLALVESEVGPFLRGVLDAGELTSDDAERARTLGDALRRALVEEADGVWLGDVVSELHDADGLVTHMDDTQRAVVEAACASLAHRRTVAIVQRAAGRAHFSLHWSRGGRGRLGPELQALLRIVFPGARVHLGARRLEFEFDVV